MNDEEEDRKLELSRALTRVDETMDVCYNLSDAEASINEALRDARNIGMHTVVSALEAALGVVELALRVNAEEYGKAVHSVEQATND